MPRIDTINFPTRVFGALAATALLIAFAALIVFTAPAARSNAAPATRGKVTVINESTLPGLAHGVAKRLRDCGYSVKVRPARTTKERHDTTLEHSAATTREATRLADTMALPADALVPNANARTIVARLGTDQVKSGTERARWILRWPACR